jgi:hypothetical protein
MIQLADYIKALPQSVTITGSFSENFIMLDGEQIDHELSRKIWDKSEAFSWGYAGSGPAQLSLAILLMYLPVELALKYFQDFKFKVIARWPQQDINLSFNLKVVMSSILFERESKENGGSIL